MKKLLVCIAVLVLGISFNANAQAFSKGYRYHSLGFGGSQFIHLGYYDGYYNYYNNNGIYSRGWLAPTTAQFNYQLEFPVHDYVGVGLTTGVGFGGGGFATYYNSEIAIPVGAIGNFHFYQLIDDKVSKDIHGDKLDIYAGVNIGSGVAFLNGPYDNDVVVLVFGGFQTGARYFFTDRFAVNLEVGYGKSFINAGIVLKSGGGK